MRWLEYVGLGIIALGFLVGGVWKFGRKPRNTISPRNPGRTGSSGRAG